MSCFSDLAGLSFLKFLFECWSSSSLHWGVVNLLRKLLRLLLSLLSLPLLPPVLQLLSPPLPNYCHLKLSKTKNVDRNFTKKSCPGVWVSNKRRNCASLLPPSFPLLLPSFQRKHFVIEVLSFEEIFRYNNTLIDNYLNDNYHWSLVPQPTCFWSPKETW